MNVPIRAMIAATLSALSLVLSASVSSSAMRIDDAASPPAPNATELLRSEPFDRITLIDNSVLMVEPVSPRPLPVIDPKDSKRARERKPVIPPEGNIIVGVPTKIDTPDSENAVDAEGVAKDEVKVHLLQAAPNEVRDFKIKRSSIKKIEYFEDFLLRECDRLIMTHDYARAFECCLRVQNRRSGWQGLDDRVNRVLFAEGSAALIEGNGERGLRLLGELLIRKRDYPGLFDQIGDAYSKRIERALKLGLYARGRRVLHELTELAPEHILVKQMQALYIKKASDLVKESEHFPPPERLDALTAALRIWPDLDTAQALYQKAFENEPTLDVAVSDVAAPLGPWIHSPADARLSRLLYLPVMEGDDDASRRGKDPASSPLRSRRPTWAGGS